MSTSEIDMARSTKSAWKRFRTALADRVEALEPAASVLVEVEAPELGTADDGCAPYVQVERCGDALAAEVSSNRYLHPSYRMDKEGRRRLRELGWERPSEGTSKNYQVRLDLAGADQVADMLVRALRDVFGVVHPAFLVTDLELGKDPLLPTVDAREDDEPLAIRPVDEEHLNRLIGEALAPMIGRPPTRDSDGDIGMGCGTGVVFVRLLPHRPMIRIFSEVALAVTDLERAVFEVQVLNRDNPEVKFRVVDDRIVAETHLLGAPFVPAQLRHTLAMMCELVERTDKDLAHRVSGHTFAGAAPALAAMPPAVRALLSLEQAKPGVLTPELVAEVCEYDAELIRRLVDGHDREPGARTRRTQKVLRKALKIVND